MWQFVTDHKGDIISLTLRNSDELEVWWVHMDRLKANTLAEALNKGSGQPIWIEGYNVNVIGEEQGGCLLLLDNGVYMAHKIVLSRGQRQDLASTIQIHIRASELDTRPKDTLTPLDDLLPGSWSPEKEKEAYGFDGHDEKDDADWWKK